MPLTRCSSASWSTSGAAVLARILVPGTRGGGYGRWFGCAVCLGTGSGGVVRLGGGFVLASCALGRVLARRGPALGGRALAAARLGGRVLGWRVLGWRVLGWRVLGWRVLRRRLLDLRRL